MKMSDKEKIRALIIGLYDSQNSASAWDLWDFLDDHLALEGRLQELTPIPTIPTKPQIPIQRPNGDPLS